MAWGHPKKKRELQLADESPTFYIREQTHHTPCSINHYWYIRIRYEDFFIQRRLNKLLFDYDEAIEIVEDYIKKYGTPLKQTNRKLSPTYGKNMRKPSNN